MTHVDQAAATVTGGSIAVTIPAGTQGGDTLVLSLASLDLAMGAPSGPGWVERKRQTVSNLLHVVWTKVAAGTVGSGSADASTVVTVPYSGDTTVSHKSGLALEVWRGNSISAPVNAATINAPETGGTIQSFTGPAATASVDNGTVVSCFASKDSTNPMNVTVPGSPGTYTKRGEARLTTGNGKATTVIATEPGGSAGSYGAEAPWTTDIVPGAVSIVTLILAPATTIQTIVPMGDITVTNAAGFPTDTAGHRFEGIDETGAPVLTDGVEIQLGGQYRCSLTALTDPGVDTGFRVGGALGMGAGTAGGTMHIKIIQGSSTVRDEWDETVSVDGQALSHDVDPTDATNIVFTSGVASDLKLDFTVTAVS